MTVTQKHAISPAPVARGVARSGKRVASSKFKFTEASIRDLVFDPAKGDRQYHFDSLVRGLCIAVTATGKTFYSYKKVAGRPQRNRIGPWPEMTVIEARKQAEQTNTQIALGANPMFAKKLIREEMTLGQLYADYLEGWIKPQKKNVGSCATDFKRVPSDWHSRKLSTITRDDVLRLHSRIGREHPTAANRTIEMLRAAFNYVIDERKTWTAGNPASGITPFPETERERFLDGDELRRFLESLMQEPELWRDYFFLCLFAGQRRRNVQAMRWDEISLERASWTIPGYKSKNRKLIDVPLSNKALAILERRKQDATGEWVFPSPTSASGHIEEPKKVWKRILKRAKIRDLHLHDLRHTNASWQVIEGASLPVVGKTLGHLDSKTTQRYAHLNQAPGLESVNRACDAMLAAGGSSPVLLSDGK